MDQVELNKFLVNELNNLRYHLTYAKKELYSAKKERDVAKKELYAAEKERDAVKKERDELQDQLIFLLSENYEDACQSNYTMIDTQFAIGSVNSSHSSFDLIVDISFPNTKGFKVDFIIKESNHFGKKLIMIHLQDDPSQKDNMKKILPIIIPQLLDPKYKRILIQGWLGESRSASIGVAFFSKKNKVSFEEALERVNQRRSIHINDGFMEAVKEYCEKNGDAEH